MDTQNSKGVPNQVSISDKFLVGGGSSSPLLLIAGPCQLESEEHALMIARELKSICNGRNVNLVFKASFDKANRTKLGSVRGLGLEAGLMVLANIRTKLDLPVLTDVHSVDQVREAGRFVDVIQIPAFLCRQTDLLIAAGESGKVINIKKGQFLAPEDMEFAAEKVASTGNRKILLCERGATFGYRDLVVDMRALVIMRASGYPVVFDATHSVQSPGGAGGKSGGRREFVAPLARAATAVGVDGLFIECHENPAAAPSDGDSMLPLNELPALLDKVLAIRAVQ